MKKSLSKSIYIIAGELSGDMHGAGLMQSVLDIEPDTTFAGYGGTTMQAVAGLKNERFHDWLDDSAVMGIVEVLKKYKWFKQQLENMLEQIKTQKPDALVLIDYPKFNLTLAQMVRDAGVDIKIIYYISPKVWAWNKKRVPKMAELLDKLLCIFPFEVPIFEEVNLPAVYVGNPLADQLGPLGSDEGRDKNLIGLFPGSREREVSKLFPIMIEAAIRLYTRNSEWKFQVPAATPKLAEQMRAMLHAVKRPDMPDISITEGESHELMRKAHCGVVASGTATLEAAWLGMPYCLVYKVAFPTYLLGKLIVKIKFIGLVNILAGKEVIEEFIQGDADPCHIERALELFMTNSEHRQKVQQDILATAELLGGPGVNDRAAKELLATLD